MSLTVDRYVNASRRRVRGFVAQQRFKSHVEMAPRRDLVTLGTDYGGWTIPQTFLRPDSVCFLAGVGGDASFDLEIMARYGCAVHAFDPAPKSAAYVRDAIDDPRYDFHPVGLSDADGEEPFFVPDAPGGISLLGYGTEVAGSFPVRSVVSLMHELGHGHIDLLKLCTEGFENRILTAMLAADVRPRVLCVEFCRGNWQSVRAYDELKDAGYALVHAQLPAAYDWKVTFVDAVLGV